MPERKKPFRTVRDVVWPVCAVRCMTAFRKPLPVEEAGDRTGSKGRSGKAYIQGVSGAACVGMRRLSYGDGRKRACPLSGPAVGNGRIAAIIYFEFVPASIPDFCRARPAKPPSGRERPSGRRRRNRYGAERVR